MLLLLKCFFAGLILLIGLKLLYEVFLHLLGYKNITKFLDMFCAIILILGFTGIVCIPIGMIALHFLGLI